MNEQRSSFSGRLGFVLSAAGSAVGLGNIWRFPYLAAKYGGGIFLLIYIILALTLGFALMTAEIAIGRKTGLSTISAFEKLNKKFAFLGWMGALVPVIVVPYYSVIGGWIIKYFFEFVRGNIDIAAHDGFFEKFSSQSSEPLFWFTIFLGMTAVIVLFGVERGIENISKLIMPALVVLNLFIAVYSLFMPGAIDGLVYYLKPDFSHFSATTVLAAMGQLFYSMSIAMGIMITYGSYMKKSTALEASVHHIEIFDTGIAFLSGLMIIPAVFAFSGGDEAALSQGSSLMFVTLPKVFENMKGGAIIGTLFFLLVFFAALTSSISLMETAVSIVRDKFGFSRRNSVFIMLGICAVLGALSSLGEGALGDVRILGMSFLDFFDFIANNLLMPIVALLTCFFVGYVIKPQAIIDEVEYGGAHFKWKKLFVVMIKYIAPICIVLILVSSILDYLGINKI